MSSDIKSFALNFHDNVHIINNYTSTNIQFYMEYSELLSEASKIEKEYFTKMDACIRKFQSKLGKRYAILSGKLQLETVEIPTTNSTLLKAVYSQCNEYLNVINEHSKYSTALQSKSDVFKLQLNKYEESRKKHVNFHQMISNAKDQQSQELSKSRQKYLDACDIVDASNQRLQKTDQMDKFKKQLEDDRTKMFEHKNNYLVSLNQWNTHVKSYYNQQVPTLMTHFESLNHRMIQFLQKQFTQINTAQVDLYQNQLQFTKKWHQDTLAIHNSDTTNASELLKETFQLPNEESFKSTPLWLDTDVLDLQESSIIYLTNIYSKSQDKLTNAANKIDQLNKEIQGLDVLLGAYKENEKLGDYEDVMEQQYQLFKELELQQIHKTKLNAQMQLIQSQLQDKLVLGNNHVFKSNNFAIPTSCEYCKANIWGKGMSCKLCQINCHPKCEVKMGLNCTKEKKKKNKSIENLSRKTMFEDSPRMSSSPRSDVSSTVIILQATAMYDYQAQDESELSIKQGDVFSVIQADNGDGWAEILIEKTQQRGVVPANYIKISQLGSQMGSQMGSQLNPQLSSSSHSNSFVTPNTNKRASTYKYTVKVLFDYDGDEGELKIKVGDEIQVITEHPDGW
eukprot:NODE_633_length_5187_cov_0.383844.p1 type:complete len:622 gc:universal NODE_633_length_5187_cov_0.383844:4037-2172(-)